MRSSEINLRRMNPEKISVYVQSECVIIRRLLVRKKKKKLLLHRRDFPTSQNHSFLLTYNLKIERKKYIKYDRSPPKIGHHCSNKETADRKRRGNQSLDFSYKSKKKSVCRQ